MIEALLITAVVLAAYFWSRARITQKAAVALGVEISFLTREIRRIAECIDTAPALFDERQQTYRHSRWSKELRRSCHKAETYYHLAVKLGTTPQWHKEHGSEHGQLG